MVRLMVMVDELMVIGPPREDELARGGRQRCGKLVPPMEGHRVEATVAAAERAQTRRLQ
jgi:hypothetical protein